MAKDLGSTVRDTVTHVARDAIRNLGDAKPAAKSSNGPLSGAKGLAAGAGLAAMVPLAKKGVDAVRSGAIPTTPTKVVGKAASTAGDRVGTKLKDTVGSKIDEAGGAGGVVKDAATGLLPGARAESGAVPGVGKGRRMPVQQAVDVAVPIETAYNQWTQFEDWPEFMHRVTRVTQEDDCTVSFATKIWGKTKEFQAQIQTQRPDERIKWRVAHGFTHSGVVTFHELAPRLTRIEVNLDIDPGSLIEKAARGMRHVKRAVRSDLHRFKAFIEMQELETGAWRGVIEDGELVEPHDDAYDEERDYSDLEETRAAAEASAGDEEEEREEEEREEEKRESQPERAQRFKRQAETSRRAPSERRSRSTTAAASRPSSSRTPGGKSGSGARKRSGSAPDDRSSSGRGSSSRSANGTSAKRGSGTGAKRKATSRG